MQPNGNKRTSTILTFSHPKLSGIVLAKVNKDFYEVIRGKDILFFVEYQKLNSSHSICRWVYENRRSPWYDRVWMCVKDGIEELDNEDPIIMFDDIFSVIKAELENRETCEDPALISENCGISQYLIKKCIAFSRQS